MVLIQEIVNLEHPKISYVQCVSVCAGDHLHQTSGHLICDSSSVVIDSEDWQWVLGLGVVGTVPMVIMALLKEGMISGLRKLAK